KMRAGSCQARRRKVDEAARLFVDIEGSSRPGENPPPYRPSVWQEMAGIFRSDGIRYSARVDSEGGFMSCWRRDAGLYSRLAGFLFVLSACTTNTPPIEAPPPTPDIPATIRPEEMVGRWGYGSYHNEGDRKRTEAAAHGQCGQPVVINKGAGGGVMMDLADNPQLQELCLKGSHGGRSYGRPP